MNPETKLEAEFTRRVRAAGGQTIKMVPVSAGIPDRLVFLPGGKIYLVELKTDTGKPSAIQKHWHMKLAELGTNVHVVYGTDGVDQWINWFGVAERA